MFQFYFQKIVGSLRHLGMVGFASMLCVAFGVLSVYSLVSLSNEVKTLFQAEPEVIMGADVEVAVNTPLNEDLAADQLTEAFEVDFESVDGLEDYTPVLSKQVPTYRLEGQGQAEIGNYSILGVNPDQFPLYGSYRFASGQSLAELIEPVGTVVVPRNFVEANDLEVGSKIDLVGADNFETRQLRIGGIIDYTENKSAAVWLMSYETFLDKIDLNERGVSLKMMLKGDEQTLVNQFQNQSGNVSIREVKSMVGVASDMISQVFDASLNGSSVLGLFIGGLGIATSVQIILRRRRFEIATLKSLGYQTGHVLLLLLGEVLVLSLLGSLLGLGLGILLSFWFLSAIQNIGGVFQLSFAIQPVTALIAVLSGILTALAFTAITVLQNARVKPATVFRNFQSTKKVRTALTNLALLLPLLGIFLLIAVFLTGSWNIGLGAVALALVGTVLSGGIFWLGFFLLTRLPARLPGSLHISWLNLKQSFGRSVVAAVAIFAGTSVLGFAMVIFDNVNSRLDEYRGDKTGWNILVYASADQTAAVQQKIDSLSGINRSTSLVRTKVEVRHEGQTRSLLLEGLDMQQEVPGRDKVSISTDSKLWLAEHLQADIVNEGDLSVDLGSESAVGFGWQVDEKIQLSLERGQNLIFTVGGFFDPAAMRVRGLGVPSPDLLLSKQHFERLVPAKQVQTVFWLESEPDQILANAEQIGQIDDSLLVYDLASFEAASLENYQNFVTFAVSLASLSLLAGLVLMINSILLSMLERRREFALLKALGYSSSQVRNLVWFEYFLVAMFVAVLAIAVDFGGVLAINAWQPNAEVVYKPIYAALTVLLALVIVLLATALSSWKTLQTKPMEVLRYE